MNTSRFAAGASRFAHLTGLARKSKHAAAEDDQNDRDDARAEDEDGDEDQPKGKRSKAKAEDDDDQPKGKRSKAKADDDDQDDDDQPKGKRSKAKAEDDDDDDDGDEPKARGKRSKADDSDEDDEDDDDKKEMTGRGAVASARLRERERCAAIFSSKAAARNPALAASLAFDTTMTRQEAITVLKGQAASARDDDDDAPRNRHARADRSSRNVQLGGNLPEQSGKQAVTSSWDSAFKKAGIATVPR